MNKKVERVQRYLAASKDYKRWRLLRCFQDYEVNGKIVKVDPCRESKASALIDMLAKKGFKAKIHAPLPEHKTSGHTHITVLCTFNELCEIMGIERRS